MDLRLEAVQDDNVVPTLNEGTHQVRADESTATRDESFHYLSILPTQREHSVLGTAGTTVFFRLEIGGGRRDRPFQGR